MGHLGQTTCPEALTGASSPVGHDRTPQPMRTSSMIQRSLPLVGLLTCALLPSLKAAEVIEADVCVYGGTASGVAAAVQATRMGKTAVIAEFGNHLGGLTSGGLGATDSSRRAGGTRRLVSCIPRTPPCGHSSRTWPRTSCSRC